MLFVLVVFLALLLPLSSFAEEVWIPYGIRAKYATAAELASTNLAPGELVVNSEDWTDLRIGDGQTHGGVRIGYSLFDDRNMLEAWGGARAEDIRAFVALAVADQGGEARAAVAALSNALAAAQASIATNAAGVSSNALALALLQTAATALSGRVTANEGAVSALRNATNELAAATATNAAAIATTGDDLRSNYADWASLSAILALTAAGLHGECAALEARIAALEAAQ